MAIKNIHPHVGIEYNAKRRVRSVTVENTAPTLFAPIVAKRGPENVPYKVYSNAEFISTFGQLEFSEQGQQVLNIGNWLNNGGAVMVYRMATVPANMKYKKNVFITYENNIYKQYIIVNGVLTENEATAQTENGVQYKYNEEKIYKPIRFALIAVSEGGKYKLNSNYSNKIFTYDENVQDGSKYVKVESTTELSVNTVYYEEITIKTDTTEVSSLDGGKGFKYYKNAELSDLKDDANQSLVIGNKALSKDDVLLACAYYADPNYLVRAKYSGSFYNGMQVEIRQTGVGVFNVVVYVNGSPVESFARKTKENYKTISKLSDYLGEFLISECVLDRLNSYTSTSAIRTTLSLSVPEGYVDNVFNEANIKDAIKTGLKDKLAVKCDYILDAGYKADTKEAIANLIAGAEGQLRDDVIFVADTIELTTKDNKFTNKLPGDASAWVNKISDSSHETRLISVYNAYLTTEDIYSATSGVETYVSPTYFLAGLIPYNELTYGCSYTNAGKRRGEVSDALYLSKNPTPEEKDALYAERLNYIEKDSTGIYFMSQSTYQQEDTALRFLNNSRSLNVIARNVERIGRNYLHEATTVTSLNNLTQAITTYMNDWVQNKALTKCEVDVYADQFDDTLVHIILNIKFPGTIEIISVEINID